MANKLPDSGPISMLDVYNVLNPPMDPKDCDYYFETIEEWNTNKEKIFENNPNLSQITIGFSDNITDLSDTFNDNYVATYITHTPKMIVGRNITNFHSCFHDIPLEYISKDLFKYCPNAVNFGWCFVATSISSIPEELFSNNKKAENFDTTFMYCDKLKEIPRIFNNNTCIKNVVSCFDGTKIVNVPFDLFDNCKNLEKVDYCFNECTEITSSLPDVWNKHKFPNILYGDYYANNCTKAANYNEIPSNFGGPAPAVPLSENTTKDSKYIPKILTAQQRTVNIPTSPISLNDKDFRKLAGISSGQISLKDFYGKPNELILTIDCSRYDGSLIEAWAAELTSITSNQNHKINIEDLYNKITKIKFEPNCIFTINMLGYSPHTPMDLMDLVYEDNNGNKTFVGLFAGKVSKILGPLNSGAIIKFYSGDEDAPVN